MRIVRYLPQRFICNVALVVDLEDTKQIIYGDSAMQVYNDEVTFYKVAQQRAVNTRTFESNDFSNALLAKYDIYTVDIYGYKELYMLVNNVAYKVFDKWQSIIADLRSKHLWSVYGEQCKYNAQSIATQQDLELKLPSSTNTAKYFYQNIVNANRLVNIAIPKSLCVKHTDFYTATGETTQYDGTHRQLLCKVFSETTYTLADFMYLAYAKGQVARLKKQRKLTVDISMQQKDGYNRQILCINREPSNMHDLEMYLTVTEDSEFYYINFAYNLNRTYVVSASTDITMYQPLSSKTAQIVSEDMLKHAAMSNKAYDGKYILTDKQSNTITLPAVYSQILGDNLPVQSWSDEAYWLAASYQYNLRSAWQPQQLNLFASQEPMFYYGNLHTFMLETDNANPPIDNDYNFHTYGLLNDGIDIAMSKVNLPVIEYGRVTFRNMTFDFRNKLTHELDRMYDGKKFAVVLRHDSNYAQQEFAKASVVTSANYLVIVLTTNLTSLLEHSGATNVSQLSIQDFYSANMYNLLVSHIYNYVARMNLSNIDISLDTTFANILMDLPIV